MLPGGHLSFLSHGADGCVIGQHHPPRIFVIFCPQRPKSSPSHGLPCPHGLSPWLEEVRPLNICLYELSKLCGLLTVYIWAAFFLGLSFPVSDKTGRIIQWPPWRGESPPLQPLHDLPQPLVRGHTLLGQSQAMTKHVGLLLHGHFCPTWDSSDGAPLLRAPHWVGLVSCQFCIAVAVISCQSCFLSALLSQGSEPYPNLKLSLPKSAFSPFLTCTGLCYTMRVPNSSQ